MRKKLLLLNLIIVIYLFFPLQFFVVRAADTGLPQLQIPIPNLSFNPQITKCAGDENKLCLTWIQEYIAGIYKYAVSIVGILATVVMMLGGVMWIVSGGSAERAGEAKAWIGASFTGLILTLTSYMILYTVNPALVGLGGFPPLKLEVVRPRADVVVYAGDTCNRYTSDPSTHKIDFFTAETASAPSACSNYNFSGYGVNEKILRSIAAVETRCGSSGLESTAGACGLMQLLPSTAQAYSSNASCDWLKNNPQESIRIAAEYIKNNAAVHNNDRFKIWAGYNAGYGATAAGGKLGAFAQSNDCPGMLAYECCINPGGLSETQGYINLAIKYYNSM